MDNRTLCDNLLCADREKEVIKILREAGYWDNPAVWRPYGDLENNYGTIGNQQSEAVAAIVEKIVNAIDARLTNECRVRGDDPEAPDAPQSIRQAVHRYFSGGGRFDPDRSGKLSNWTDALLNAQGDLITLTATGMRPEGRRGQREVSPCITIADSGEGQCPDDFPHTFLSLHRNNKIRIKFVQGKFNMGATGALPYCSKERNFQLIVSRRNPELVPPDAAGRADEWGFTVVRRRDPSADSRSSIFEYLAPSFPAHSRYGAVMSFRADSYPIFPERQNPYARNSRYGSLVKLYEYRWEGIKSDITWGSRGNVLFRRLAVALAEPALPFKVFDCRYGNHPWVVRGIITDLERNEGLEEGFPQSIDLGVARNHQVKVRIYAFKPGIGENHRTARHGVLFLYNGQLHASFPINFFRRQKVRKGYLANDLLVTVDCSSIDRRDFEDLFMNSRDRLRSDSPLSTEIEGKLESFLFQNEQLRALEKNRRDAAIASKYQEDNLREDLLKEILAVNPEISRYLLVGANLVHTGRGSRPSPNGRFEGKQFPTYFDPGRAEYNVGVGRKVQLEFKTDAENNYFDREVSPGKWSIADGDGSDWTNHWDRPGPNDGTARFYWDTGILPPSVIKAGEEFDFTVSVSDERQIEPFQSTVKVKIIEPVNRGGGGGGRRRGGDDAVASPNIFPVYEPYWEGHTTGSFTSKTAVRIAADPSSPTERETWDFYVNMDNEHIHDYSRRKNQPLEAVRGAFSTAAVFLSLAVIRGVSNTEPANDRNNGDIPGASTEDIPGEVARITEYIAPVLLPVVDSLTMNPAEESSEDPQMSLFPQT